MYRIDKTMCGITTDLGCVVWDDKQKNTDFNFSMP